MKVYAQETVNLDANLKIEKAGNITIFDVSPVQIIMYAKIGDSKTITSQIPPTDYTFIIKNKGDTTLNLAIKPQGDYADWVSLEEVLFDIWQNETLDVVVEPGDEKRVRLKINVPYTATLRFYYIPIVLEDLNSKSKLSAELVVHVYEEVADFPIYLYNKLYYPAVRFEELPDGKWVDWDGQHLRITATETLEIPFAAKLLFLIVVIYLLTKVTAKPKEKIKHKWMMDLLVIGVSMILMLVW